MLTLEIRSATERDQQAVIAAITLAFTTDPVARWALPKAETYVMVMPAFARAFGGNGFEHGAAHLVEGAAAAAMWLPPGIHPDGERMAALIDEHLPEDRRSDMVQVMQQMDAHHPAEPCWYLPMIGVDPVYQGRGYGSALLRYALERCDLDGVPAYLESSNPRNIPLYQRHGFEIIGRIQAGSSPAVVPMLRRAH